MSEKLKEIWFCEACQSIGQIEYDRHAGVMEVFYQIKDAHQSHSPYCPNTVMGLRVLKTIEPDTAEWVKEAAKNFGLQS